MPKLTPVFWYFTVTIFASLSSSPLFSTSFIRQMDERVVAGRSWAMRKKARKFGRKRQMEGHHISAYGAMYETVGRSKRAFSQLFLLFLFPTSVTEEYLRAMARWYPATVSFFQTDRTRPLFHSPPPPPFSKITSTDSIKMDKLYRRRISNDYFNISLQYWYVTFPIKCHGP